MRKVIYRITCLLFVTRGNHLDCDIIPSRNNPFIIFNHAAFGMFSFPKKKSTTGSLAQRPGKAAVFLHVQGCVDLDIEISKAITKLDKVTEGLQKCHNLLGDADFLGKADEKVVKVERAKLAGRNMTDMISQF